MKNWSSEIDETTQQFTSLFGSLTQEQLNWKPSATTWSIAQNIDHLITINESYYPVIEDLRSGKYKMPFLGKFGFITSFFGNLILKSVQPDRKRKVKTFPIWEPSSSTISGDIVARFQQHQQELKKLIAASGDLIQKGAVISSPANKNIVYKLDTAFDILVDHEKRHLEQAKEVLEKLPTA